MSASMRSLSVVDSPTKQRPSGRLSDVLSHASALEGDLVTLSELLQLERAQMVGFEIEPLLETTQKKQHVLRRLGEGAQQRGRIFRQAFARLGLDPSTLPGQVPAALRQMALNAPADAAALADMASRLEVLVDVVEELQVLNRALLHRTLSWLDGCLTELAGEAAPGTYTASGRIRERSMATTRRTI